MKHKGIDYKTSAVQYYLNNNESVIDTVLLILGEFFKECQPKKRIN